VQRDAPGPPAASLQPDIDAGKVADLDVRYRSVSSSSSSSSSDEDAERMEWRRAEKRGMEWSEGEPPPKKNLTTKKEQ